MFQYENSFLDVFTPGQRVYVYIFLFLAFIFFLVVFVWSTMGIISNFSAPQPVMVVQQPPSETHVYHHYKPMTTVYQQTFTTHRRIHTGQDYFNSY
jgi:hypothetical protein